MANAAPNGGIDIPIGRIPSLPKGAPYNPSGTGGYPVTPNPDWKEAPTAPTPRTFTPFPESPNMNPFAPAPEGPPSAPPTFDPGNLDEDPWVIEARNQQNSIQRQIDDWLREVAGQSIIKFGDPALASMAGFGIDPQAADFARQNYLSGNADLARLDKARDQARRAVINRLAARGILGSGDLGYGEAEADKQYGNQVYDARSALLQYLRSAQDKAITSKSNTAQIVSNARQQAYERAVAKYNATLAAWVAAHGGQ